MTTAYRLQQSPRLPDNHPQHVEAVLERARLADIQTRADAYQRGAYAAYVAGQRRATRRRHLCIALLIVALLYFVNRLST
jgi:hypothetical protein